MLLKGIRTLREVWQTWNTNWPPENVDRVLVVQSASPARFREVLSAVERRFVAARVDIAVRDYTLSYLDPARTAGIFVLGKAGKRESLKLLRRNQYDTVVLCATGEPDHWKLKVMAFCLGARQVICYNEHGGAFVVSRWHWRALPSHFLHRWSTPGHVECAPRRIQWRRFLRGPAKLPARLFWFAQAIGWEARRWWTAKRLHLS